MCAHVCIINHSSVYKRTPADTGHASCVYVSKCVCKLVYVSRKEITPREDAGQGSQRHSSVPREPTPSARMYAKHASVFVHDLCNEGRVGTQVSVDTLQTKRQGQTREIQTCTRSLSTFTPPFRPILALSAYHLISGPPAADPLQHLSQDTTPKK